MVVGTGAGTGAGSDILRRVQAHLQHSSYLHLAGHQPGSSIALEVSHWHLQFVLPAPRRAAPVLFSLQKELADTKPSEDVSSHLRIASEVGEIIASWS
jgi:hypothetical protein